MKIFDQARLVSDSDLQDIYANLLAGEANEPGSFSRRTIDVVASLDKSDALLFRKFGAFVWSFSGTPLALVYNVQITQPSEHDLMFIEYQHLNNLGLLKVDQSGYHYNFSALPAIDHLAIKYFNGMHRLSNQNGNITQFQTGKVLLTNAGAQLWRICGAEMNQSHYEYVIANWINSGLHPSVVIGMSDY